jgi:hypothetical protein
LDQSGSPHPERSRAERGVSKSEVLLNRQRWERGSPEPLVGCGDAKEERLWRAALPAFESIETLASSQGEVSG